jgi:hypothetical protein
MGKEAKQLDVQICVWEVPGLIFIGAAVMTEVFLRFFPFLWLNVSVLSSDRSFEILTLPLYLLVIFTY